MTADLLRAKNWIYISVISFGNVWKILASRSIICLSGVETAQLLDILAFAERL